MNVQLVARSRRERVVARNITDSPLLRSLTKWSKLQVISMEQPGDAATETTSILSTKPSPTAHCQRHRALHHCGDPDQFPTTGQTFVDSLSHRVQIVI